jgi:hypothetical protein
MCHGWNKGPGIWFPLSRGVAAVCLCAAEAVRVRDKVCSKSAQYPLHPRVWTLSSAQVPALRGVERLSFNKKTGSDMGADRKETHKKVPDEKKGRKQKAGDIGRALRTIYDDTLRETVPDDFSDLLGKLS